MEPVLLPVETEAIIEGLQNFEMKEVGSPRFVNRCCIIFVHGQIF